MSHLLLLATAAIWGFGFIAQRLGMTHLGPFSYNACRFLLGALSMLPLIWWLSREQAAQTSKMWHGWGQAIPVGLWLFGGASLQQVGLQLTSVANAAFITGLYMVIVPLIAVFWGLNTAFHTWLGAGVALVGLFLIADPSNSPHIQGDLLVLLGAGLWAMHLLWIDKTAKQLPAVTLACIQFLVCGLLSGVVALAVEVWSWQAIWQSAWPILYGGLCSTALAYSLQIMGQRHAHPAMAAVILSFEAVFAAVGGWWWLDERLSTQAIVGCVLMLCGMLLAQFPMRWLWKSVVRR